MGESNNSKPTYCMVCRCSNTKNDNSILWYESLSSLILKPKVIIWHLYLNERRQQNWWEPFGTYCWSGLYCEGETCRIFFFLKLWNILKLWHRGTYHNCLIYFTVSDPTISHPLSHQIIQRETENFFFAVIPFNK